jgi:hypothetical protein
MVRGMLKMPRECFFLHESWQLWQSFQWRDYILCDTVMESAVASMGMSWIVSNGYSDTYSIMDGVRKRSRLIVFCQTIFVNNKHKTTTTTMTMCTEIRLCKCYFV